MKKKQYEILISKVRNDYASMKDNWKFILLILAFILIKSDPIKLFILFTGIRHYLTLWLTVKSSDKYLNGFQFESFRMDKIIRFLDIGVSMDLVFFYSVITMGEWWLLLF